MFNKIFKLGFIKYFLCRVATISIFACFVTGLVQWSIADGIILVLDMEDMVVENINDILTKADQIPDIDKGHICESHRTSGVVLVFPKCNTVIKGINGILGRLEPIHDVNKGLTCERCQTSGIVLIFHKQDMASKDINDIPLNLDHI
jgi:hypothetical protein